MSVNSFINKATIGSLNKIIKQRGDSTLRMRNIGCIGVGSCDVASSKVDYSICNSGKFWDYAPAYLIMKESGCVVKNLSGKAWQFSDTTMIAGNAALVRTALKALKKE